MPRLRRSDTSVAGLRRVPRGRGFQYLAADGTRPDAADLDRIRQLVIPPAWTEVCVRPGWPATQGQFEASVIRLLSD
jgi:DNA topoisomerase I